MNRINKIALISAIAALSAITVFANPPAGNPVDRYGRLFADGNKIVGEKSGGEAVQVKGPSFPWSVAQWGTSRFFVTEAVDAMIDGWKADVLRFPLGISYVSPAGCSPNSTANPCENYVTEGYDTDPEGNWGRVKLVTDHAISRGVYAIVDWHAYYTHSAERTQLAIDFFTNPELAGQYGDNPAVIFEIYNEPIGPVPDWGEPGTTGPVKAYAEAVIGAIRAAGFNNLIIVGNPRWSSVPDVVAANPPVDANGNVFGNIAVSFHFYSQGHRLNTLHYARPGKTFRQVILDVLDAGFPVFVSEWGATHPGSQFLYDFPSADLWHNFLDSLKISSCAWNVAVSGSVQDFWTVSGNPLNTGSWTDPYAMTPHGKYVYHWLTKGDTATPPRRQVYDGERKPVELVADALNPYGNDGSEMLRDVDSAGVMHAVFTLEQGDYEWTPYAGIHHAIDWLAEHCKFGLAYTYKGAAHSFRIEQSNVRNYATHMTEYTRQTDEWTEVVVPWSGFIQPGWNTIPVAVNPDSIEAISWYVERPAGTAGEFWIKDVYCLCDADGGKWISVRNQGARTSSAVSPLVKIAGRNLQLRLPSDGRVDVYTINGKRVRTMKFPQGNHNIRINNLSRGTYIVNVTAGASAKQSVRMLIK
ncbi:MAG: cellulase family glycosylhydrolase [Chitinispirillia bacterium]|nr:cellulase family glycosylhydrolase [Chitinispirillia bacterium]